MSYTKAINKPRNRIGKLFREATKAECVSCPKGIKPSFYTKDGITQFVVGNSARQYPRILFNYIQNNLVKAGLAEKITDWEYSSAVYYFGGRNGSLIDKEMAK